MTRKPKAADRRIRTNVYLDAEQKAALERLTEATRVPWAEYVREGVDLVLKKYRKLIKAGKGK
jgi:hypothetical protein